MLGSALRSFPGRAGEYEGLAGGWEGGVSTLTESKPGALCVLASIRMSDGAKNRAAGGLVAGPGGWGGGVWPEEE